MAPGAPNFSERVRATGKTSWCGAVPGQGTGGGSEPPRGDLSGCHPQEEATGAAGGDAEAAARGRAWRWQKWKLSVSFQWFLHPRVPSWGCVTRLAQLSPLGTEPAGHVPAPEGTGGGGTGGLGGGQSPFSILHPLGCPAGGQLGCTLWVLLSCGGGRVQARCRQGAGSNFAVLPSFILGGGTLARKGRDVEGQSVSPGRAGAGRLRGAWLGGSAPSRASVLGLRGHRKAGWALVRAGGLQPSPSPAAMLGGADQGQWDVTCGMSPVGCSLQMSPGGCSLQDVTHGMPSVGCHLWDALFGILPVGCHVWDATCGMLPAGCHLQDALRGMSPVGCSLWGALCGVLPAGCHQGDAPCGMSPVGCHQ